MKPRTIEKKKKKNKMEQSPQISHRLRLVWKYSYPNAR